MLFQMLKAPGFDFRAERIFPVIPVALIEMHLRGSQTLGSCKIMHWEKNSKTGRK